MVEISKILVIVAHPDDAEFFCGGSVAKWVREGKEVVYCVVTDGDKGTDDRNLAGRELAQIRREEQKRAAEILGVKEVVFFGYEDGEVEVSEGLKRDIVRAIRRYKPDMIVCQDPQSRYSAWGYLNHPDHLAVGEAVLSVVYPGAGNINYFPELLDEGLGPWQTKEIYLIGTEDPNFEIEISEAIETKIRAILEHKSQIKDEKAMVTRVKEKARKTRENKEGFYENFRRIKVKW